MTAANMHTKIWMLVALSRATTFTGLLRLFLVVDSVDSVDSVLGRQGGNSHGI